MSDNNKIKPTEYKLLIEIVFCKNRKFLNKQQCLIQNKPSRFGFKIKNIGDKSTPEATIENLSFRSAEGGNILHPFDEKFSIPKINPDQEIILWWSDILVSIIKGQTWVSFDINPQSSSKKFATFQNEGCNKKMTKCDTENRWGYGIVIRGELEQQQARTNFLILILTLLVFLEGVWGLNVIINNIFKGFGWFFSLLGSLLIKIAA